MTATDLRIGNFINQDETLTKVYQLDISSRSFYRINNIPIHKGTFRHIDTDKIVFTPIPLTEEWLLKFGFTLLYKSNQHSTYEIRNGRFSYYFWYGNKRQYLSVGGTNFICNHVHNLQNIVHSLTNEELTYEN